MAKKQKTKKSRTEGRVRLTIAIVVIAVLVCGSLFAVYKFSQSPIRTVTADIETVRTTIQAQAFVFRDEERIDASFSGFTVPFVQDGEHVGSNAQIAARFSDADSAQRYTEMLELQRDYDRIQTLATATDIASMRVEMLTSKAEGCVFDFLQAADSGNVLETAEYEQDYLTAETILEVSLKGSVDFSGKLEEISKRIQSLKSSLGRYTTVTTGIGDGGFFYSETDGFEDTLSVRDIDTLSVRGLDAALSAGPSGTTGGKLLRDFGWYVAFAVDKDDAQKLSGKLGLSVSLRFPQSGVRDISAVVHAVRADGSGRSLVILRCTDSDENLLRLRKVRVEMTIHEYKGLKVPVSALRVREMTVVQAVDAEDEVGRVDTVNGVYIMRGEFVSFRIIRDPIYRCDEFVLVPVSGKKSKYEKPYIGLYDEIITEGKDLEDGALIYQ